jgi:hypothetical protein
MSNLIRFSFLLFLMSYQLKADELSYFSDGIDYWDNGKKL